MAMQFPDTGGTGDLDSKDFVSLKDGHSVVGVLRGSPVIFYTHWNGRFSVPCKNKECTNCANGEKPKFRARFNFILKDGTSYTPKILEQGWKTYEAIKDLHENDYDLERTVIKITRKGSSQNDTRYSVTPIPNQTVSDELNKTFSQIKLFDLSTDKKEAQEPVKHSEAGDFGDINIEDSPF